MRTISKTSSFKADAKRLSKNPRYRGYEESLSQVVESLIAGLPIPFQFRDHLLTGNWKGFRECHLRPDLLLIYREDSPDSVTLVRVGTHSDLF